MCVCVRARVPTCKDRQVTTGLLIDTELAVCGAAGRAQPEGMASRRALRQGHTWHT